MENFILSALNEFLLIFYLSNNDYYNELYIYNYQFFITELIFVCLTTYMYHLKFKRNSMMIIILVVIFEVYRMKLTKIPVRHIVSQFINLLYFSDKELSTKEFFEFSFGRNMVRLISK